MTDTLMPRLATSEPEVLIADPAKQRMRRERIIRVVSIVVTLLAWEVFGRRVNPLFMSYPTSILAAGLAMTQTGELPKALFESLRTLCLGYAAAAIVGVGGGLVIGRYRSVEAAVDWLINGLYATPLVALIPLVILWLGLGFPAKFFIVFLLAIFPILINTITGVRNVNRAYIDVGVAFVASERDIFRKIIFPGSLPYIMAGLRLGIGRAIIGMVTAEFFTAIGGLGGLVVKYGNQFRTDQMLVPVLILMFFGIALTGALHRAERAIAPWKVSEQASD
jgi:ABC-type nitrate/sulfonate/bicarbonate transport system permease component